MREREKAYIHFATVELWVQTQESGGVAVTCVSERTGVTVCLLPVGRVDFLLFYYHL